MKVIDPNIQRKGKILNDHLKGIPIIRGDIPSFSLVEFNITELCNRICSFCPRVDPNVYPNRNEFMDLKLYEKIMNDLADIEYSGKILYSCFSEPLLHKQVEKLFGLSKKFCPNSRLEIVSNGDTVTAEKLRLLFDAGLDTISISMYDGPHQRELFLKLKKEVGLSDEQMILRIRYLSAEEHYGITLSNRAGNVNLSEAGIIPIKEPLKAKCFYPFYQITIDYDGTVLLCPHDWGKVIKAGNLNNDSIVDVWTAHIMNFARKRLSKANRHFSPCDVCDVKGSLMGRAHFEQWQKYFHERSSHAK